MRRLVVVVPILSLLLFFFVIPLGAATTVTIGDIFSETEVTTSLMINDVTDIAGVTVKLTYDPSVIIVTEAEKGDLPSFIANLECAGEGWVKIAAYTTGDEGLDGNVKLADLTITPTGNYGKISDLAINVETLSDSEYRTIDADVIDGFFYIGVNGDVNADGSVDTADSDYIAKGIAGTEELKAGASEVSGDGIVDAYDCVYLARHAAGISGYEELR